MEQSVQTVREPGRVLGKEQAKAKLQHLAVMLLTMHLADLLPYARKQVIDTLVYASYWKYRKGRDHTSVICAITKARKPSYGMNKFEMELDWLELFLRDVLKMKRRG